MIPDEKDSNIQELFQTFQYFIWNIQEDHRKLGKMKSNLKPIIKRLEDLFKNLFKQKENRIQWWNDRIIISAVCIIFLIIIHFSSDLGPQWNDECMYIYI